MQIDTEHLIEVAKQASENAYAVYSNFHVGAAILADDGQVYPGCNVENASYGLTNCAERTAIFSAVAAGCKRILAVAVYTPTEHIVTPCGACRQVIAEFAEDIHVTIGNATGQVEEFALKDLLPHSFSL